MIRKSHLRSVLASTKVALALVLFKHLPFAEVQDYATKWLWSYNHERPNMALGDITPKQKLTMTA